MSRTRLFGYESGAALIAATSGSISQRGKIYGNWAKLSRSNNRKIRLQAMKQKISVLAWIPSLSVQLVLGCSAESDRVSLDGVGVSETPQALVASRWGLGMGDAFQIELTELGPGPAAVFPGVAEAVSQAALEHKQSEVAVPEVRRPKIYPELLKRSGMVDVIILLEDSSYEVPQLPRLDPNETRLSASWAAKAAVIDAEVSRAKARRVDSQKELVAALVGAGGTIKDQFWLINGIDARVPASFLKSLEARTDVLEVTPAEGGGPAV